MDRYVTHASFTLERSYPAPPARVFAAWADPALKSRWFTGGDALDRGGREEQGACVYRGSGLRVGEAGRHVGGHPAAPAHRDLEAGLRPGGHHLIGRGLEPGLQVSHRCFRAPCFRAPCFRVPCFRGPWPVP